MTCQLVGHSHAPVFVLHVESVRAEHEASSVQPQSTPGVVHEDTTQNKQTKHCQ